MTAADVAALLKARHAKDVFVPQCMMGASGSRTLDGWALLPTWSPLTTIGYEIKVTRSDWLRDTKWHEYLSVCHLMYMVAPKGVVGGRELPSDVGLLEPIGKGTGMRLVVRVKPVRREPDHLKLVRLMAHVLMWRKDIGGAAASVSREQRAAFWRERVEQKKDFGVIGRSVKGRMREMLREANDAQQRAEGRARLLTEADAVIQELGITWGDRWSMRRCIQRAMAGDDVTQLLETIRSATQQLQAMEQRVELAMTAGRGR